MSVGRTLTNDECVDNPSKGMIVSGDSSNIYRRIVRTHPELVRLYQWCFFKRKEEAERTAACDEVMRKDGQVEDVPSAEVGCINLTEITNVVPFTNGTVFETPQKFFIPRAFEEREEVDGGLVVLFPPVLSNGGDPPPTTASSDVLIVVEFNEET
uniref:Uncharacterized protein n=1 Tax=Anopheles maculatus TaxID=74869 RepID=A0A182SSK1_9DIPT